MLSEFGSAVKSMEVMSRVWKCCPECGSAVESMEVLSRVRKCCREYGSAVESKEVLSRVWKCCRVPEKQIVGPEKKVDLFTFY